jgi:hypothetical protein
MSVDITQLLATLAGETAWLGIAAWLCKSLITNRLKVSAETEIQQAKTQLDRESTAFQVKLQSQANSSIEQLKSNLQLVALEHQVRFSKLHEKRADVIAETYRLLVQAELAGKQYVWQLGHVPAENEGEPPPAIKRLIELDAYVDSHRIYLPPSVCARLNEISANLREYAVHAKVYGEIESPTPQTTLEKNQGFSKAFRAFEGAIPAMRQALEEEFRVLLGDISRTSAPVSTEPAAVTGRDSTMPKAAP